ncbi:urease accessory protein UreD [Aquisalimonas lutea]|uniref:urease accessory protein UreD n=1 Tax=Aquisalimonas lutea TaxID=1327750 RepID=UPI0025B4B132|nr:urease accessory protein UreD [Aquisalimonas lutea]MDN3516401.1 urease accessory protein UreD [Aquisalimonas lutea]
MAAVAIQPEDVSGPPVGAGWLGWLDLDYQVRGGRTVLVRRRHEGPLLVQRSFHPEGPVCHNYVIHPPGGLAGGDRLNLDVRIGPEGHALLTTPAAAKFYRTERAAAVQEQTFDVGDGAALEFLPMESILHGRSDTVLRNRFRLAPDARLCTWDILCLGRPGSGDHFEGARCRQELVIERSGAPLLHECLNLAHGDPLLERPWGLDGHSAIATLVATPAPDDLEARLREALVGVEGVRLGVTRMNDVLVLRCLAPGTEVARGVLERAWRVLREPVLGRAPSPPRIWKT